MACLKVDGLKRLTLTTSEATQDHKRRVRTPAGVARKEQASESRQRCEICHPYGNETKRNPFHSMGRRRSSGPHSPVGGHEERSPSYRASQPSAMAAMPLRGTGEVDGKRLFPMSANALRLAWERLKRRAGIRDLRFHDLRHEAISRFFEMGLSTRK
jgi:hypothetical protein